MQLKQYQQNSLDILKKYFELCRIVDHVEAFNSITSMPEIAGRLANLKNKYTAWESIPNTPRVCIKVPTGGGKTILAAHAIKIVSHIWCEKEFPVVLWFVPSDTIRRQTAEALKDNRHPYRLALDAQFEGKVKIFDLDEKFNIRPSDIEGNACIIVSTIQSFVKEKTEKYNVYRDNENVDVHFVKMPAASYAGMEKKENDSRPKYSFSNLLYYHRPIMIVDEAHKVVTELSQETIKRLNPSAVIEFTATPQTDNNTLYCVRASELKDEEMIKLPIVLVEHTHWQNAVDEALNTREALEKDAEEEWKKNKDYVRPILLFQAQSKDKEVTIEILYQYLHETLSIPKEQIKIATGEQKELDGINLFNRDEPTRFIITVEALKEGWDCSFAYVLCSLANIKSDTSIEQLLGRVMRMPHAKSRKTPSLNKAYAHVVSPYFEAHHILTEKLNKRGFDETEAQRAIEQSHSQNSLDANFTNEINACILQTPLDKKTLPSSVVYDKNTLFFTPETTHSDIAVISKKCEPAEKAALEWKFNNYRTAITRPAAAIDGEPFKVPSLKIEIEGELFFASPDVIFKSYNWNINEHAIHILDENAFTVQETGGKGFTIDIDGNKLKYANAEKNQFLPYMNDSEVWSETNFIYWLDRELKQDDISQPQMLEWLRRNIEYLTETRKIPLMHLVTAKFSLLYKLENLIKASREKARVQSFELFKIDKCRKELDFNTGFIFKQGMYENIIPYTGNHKFNNHFLSPVPAFDGDDKSEELQCAAAIDSTDAIKYWVRNISKHPASFRLPTSTDYFYPDFIAKLKDGRLLVVEYKGKHLLGNNDTKEKANIAQIWAKLSKGEALFLLATIDKKTGRDENGKTLEQQIKEKIEQK